MKFVYFLQFGKHSVRRMMLYARTWRTTNHVFEHHFCDSPTHDGARACTHAHIMTFATVVLYIQHMQLVGLPKNSQICYLLFTVIAAS